MDALEKSVPDGTVLAETLQAHKVDPGSIQGALKARSQKASLFATLESLEAKMLGAKGRKLRSMRQAEPQTAQTASIQGELAWLEEQIAAAAAARGGGDADEVRALIVDLEGRLDALDEREAEAGMAEQQERVLRAASQEGSPSPSGRGRQTVAHSADAKVAGRPATASNDGRDMMRQGSLIAAKLEEELKSVKTQLR